MNMHLESPARLVLDLSSGDLARLGLTYQTISYTSPATRMALQHLLADAAEKTGFDPENGKLLIEVFPAPDLGCTIRFTRLDSKRLRRVEEGVRLYEFQNCESMMAAMEQLCAAGLFGGSLYVSGQTYRLLFSCKAPSAADRLLCEYGAVLGKDPAAVAFTKEHFKKLCNDPIRKIGRMIAEKKV